MTYDYGTGIACVEWPYNSCTNGQTRACADGCPAGGTQTCMNGQWGQCKCKCDLKANLSTGSATTVDPGAGGSVLISGSISDTSGKPITWTLTYPGGSAGGDGSTVLASWDGKIGNKYAAPGSYSATLSAQNTAGCSDSKTVTITVVQTPGDCKLQISITSSANAASGNLSHNQSLFSTKGSGLAASMTLYYNSLDPYSGPLGTGWTHNYDIAVSESNDGSVVMLEGNGGRRIYTRSGSGYTSQPGDYSVLTRTADGAFVVTHKDGTKYNFGRNGKISSITDRNGNAVTFTYAGGNLASITDPSARTATISYDGANHMTSLTDPSGNVYSFTVSSNMLTGVTYPDGGGWAYTYDDNAFMLTKTDPDNNIVTYAYDDHHRLISSTDPEGKVRSISYPTGTDAVKTTAFTEAGGGVWQYTYDTRAGLLTSKTDPQGGVTSYTYDGNRNTLSKTEPDGTAASYAYDASGNMTSTTDALGQTTNYAYNTFGQVTSITDLQGNATTNSYDAKGNLVSATDPTGETTNYQSDSKGNVISVTNAAGQTTSYAYDRQNNLTSVTDPTGATTKFTYDTSGNITSQTDANGNTTQFEYNSQNQLIKIIDPNGNATAYSYDKNGNRVSQTDANGNTTKYEYNYKGQLTKVTDALGNVTTYTYGSAGCPSCGGGGDKLTSVTDAKSQTTEYQYDTLGRLVKETDPLGNSISYSYDVKGNLTSKTDANGNTISYAYDSLSKLLKKTYPDQTTETFAYDAKGNILTATNANISYTFSYDKDGRITNVTDSNSRTVDYQYNALGNRTQMIYPEGSKVTYNYDKANRLSSIVNGGGRTYAYQYDSLGRRTKLLYPNGVTTSYSYDSAGRLTNLLTQDSAHRVINSYAYTLDKIGNRLARTEPDVKYSYGYDSIYRLLQSLPAELHGKGKDAGHEREDGYGDNRKAESFTYDPVGNRLTGPTNKLAYTYNQGNELTSDSKYQYQYDKNGNLVKKTEINDDGKFETWVYTYDYENRLIKAVKQDEEGTTTVAFKYDPFGRRIEKKIEETDDGKMESKTHDYVYDGDSVILENVTKAEEGESRTETTRYIQGPGVDEHLAVESKGDLYYYHADGLGSITALTDKKQKLVQTYGYDSFGNVKQRGDRIKQSYAFTGREWDKETGLYYYRARYYDAKVGRFIEKDPIRLKGGINLYSYVGNNPVNRNDPLGLLPGGGPGAVIGPPPGPVIGPMPPSPNRNPGPPVCMRCAQGPGLPPPSPSQSGWCYKCDGEKIAQCLALAYDQGQAEACQAVCSCPTPACRALCVTCAAIAAGMSIDCVTENCHWERCQTCP